MTIIWSPEGSVLNAEEKERLQHPYSSGLILFAKNYANPQQLRELTRQARALSPKALISTDHEGGRVQRFLTDFTQLPAASEIGAAYIKHPRHAALLAEFCGRLAGAELMKVGVNLNYAPVLDIATRLNQSVGGKAGRCWGEDEEAVTLLATQYIAGLHENGVAAVGKHFPGHGSANADSHIELPRDDRSPIQGIADLQPFIRCKDYLQGVLTAHVVYPDMEERPATFSSLWLKGMLRDEIGYQGPIISDDLTMGAVKQQYADQIEGAVEDALDAGNDYLLVCNDQDAIRRALKHLDARGAPLPRRRFSIPDAVIPASDSTISLCQQELAKLPRYI